MNADQVNKRLRELRSEVINHRIGEDGEYEMPDGDWYFDPALGYWETDQKSCDCERRQE